MAVSSSVVHVDVEVSPWAWMVRSISGMLAERLVIRIVVGDWHGCIDIGFAGARQEVQFEVDV